MTRNHGGGLIGREIIEKESLRKAASRRHLGGIWKASGRHLEDAVNALVSNLCVFKNLSEGIANLD